jgi:membrane associated rhomboid family serine protease
MKMKRAVFLFAAIEFYLTITPGDSAIAHVAHLFGAIGAFVYLKSLQKISQPSTKRKKRLQAVQQKSAKKLAAIRKAQIKRKIPKKL